MEPAPTRPRNKRPTVGLDVPCKKCGRPIYYNYKGPVEGLCGRCSDGVRTKPVRIRRSRRIGFFEGKRKRDWVAAILLLGAFAAAVYIILQHV
jgi:hypothetical protein